MIWNTQVECMSRNSMKELQLEHLKNIVRVAYENVPMYKRKFDEIGLRPEHIQTLKDIEKIPFTTKNDLRDNYPYGLFAVPLKKIVRLHASSGTTGKPIVVGYTKNDMENWSENIARLVIAAGGREEDIAQVVFGYGLFTGGFGLHQGLEKVGITVVPSSSGHSERQLMLMQDFGTTILVGTPSYALYLAEIADEMGLDKSKLKLKLGLFGGEGHTPEMRAEIERRWGIKATENYGLSEIQGPGVAGECYCQCGMHINEDHFYPEIVNSETGEALEYGNKGELILTTLTKEGIPMLRYRTKDITILNPEKCECGRTSVRMNKVLGRTDDMLIIRGVNVFPSQIESVLVGMEGIGPHYQIIVTKNGYMDAIEVHVELIDGKLLEKFSELEKLEKKIRHELKVVLQIDAKVKLVEPKSIERTTGKAKRVIDMRNQ
ncbi:LOW QUALITY PROTEIN: Phenylacetate--CoA ligase [Ruminiclostridium papyrosolvens DSM 2782]|uniref:Phenylacetate-coenzyme A ligase n=1 Tax=Ruminiclostridium papyrosolvens DSM 2782 TaxID=588581 RepID=F1T9X8_9FIRM|nr:phenylacetate--CoA ligase [Ruminiclostridium papyrosolvens]EGD48720.1 LOW QUALITY PROTEIN: Phenylacetate--CoA ligase [Ruminiclostridium papyrosolvens DSM 2782]WES32524.1 phenylacetate--CoA ligase [Ruminiclostridium papyrosolvens DSM 2782]